MNKNLVSNEGSHKEWDTIWEMMNEDVESYTQFTRNRKFNDITQFWQKNYANDLLNLIKGRNYNTFLELGAGKGTTSMYLADAGYSNITLVDLSKQGEKLANQQFKYFGLKTPKYIIANVEHTPLESGYYDCIYNIGLLEHFLDPKPTLVESFRLLKNNGLIFMPIVPDQPFYKSILCRLFLNPLSVAKYIIKLFLRPIKEGDANMIRTAHNRKFYENICKDIGFRNIRCMPYNPYWKVNSNRQIERNLTLPIYDFHLKLIKRRQSILLSTWNLSNVCYLLIAEK